MVTNKSSPLEKIKAYLQCHERDNVPDQPNIFGANCEFDWEMIYDLLYPYFNNSLDSIDQVLLADYNGKLMYNFAPINDSIHEFHQVKKVTPLISEEVIRYVTAFPSKYKYNSSSDIEIGRAHV